jgi:hypothetical protein
MAFKHSGSFTPLIEKRLRSTAVKLLDIIHLLGYHSSIAESINSIDPECIRSVLLARSGTGFQDALIATKWPVDLLRRSLIRLHNHHT